MSERSDDDRLVEHHSSSRARYSAERLRRHWRWGRQQGFGRLVEEDRLNPVERLLTATRKAVWRRRQGVEPGTAVPVWVVGVQRSGTNMLVRGLEQAPEFEVHNENDRRAFRRFELRADSVVEDLVRASRHRYVLFKPLCDSHRVDHLLDDLHCAPGRAIWAYRDVDGRVRSAVAKFGDTNRAVLARIASGRGEGMWQAQRLSQACLELVGSFDYEKMSAEDGAALFWYARNSLYFDLGLDRREDVRLVSYGATVADPEPGIRSLCNFIGLDYSAGLSSHISSRSVAAGSLDLAPRIRAACDELTARLDAVAAAQV